MPGSVAAACSTAASRMGCARLPNRVLHVTCSTKFPHPEAEHAKRPATELSGGEAQRIKLATELQRSQRGRSLYVLDEPTTGLHASDADRLLVQLQRLVDAGNTVVMVEHDMRAVAQADWVVDVGPGAGAAGGSIVVAGSPQQVARKSGSRTAPFLARELARVE